MREKSKRKILTPKRKKELDELVDDLFYIYPQKGDFVDVMAILSAEGIHVKRRSFEESLEGLSVCKKKKWYIFLNEASDKYEWEFRVLFTLAHEFGHIYIPSHRLMLFADGMMKRKAEGEDVVDTVIEKEADYFASCLLMPKEWMLREFDGDTFSFEVLVRTATKLRVSLSSMLVRYVSLDLAPILVVRSLKGKKFPGDIPWRSSLFPYWSPKVSEDGCFPSGMLAVELYEKGGNGGIRSKVHATGDLFLLKENFVNPENVTETCFYIGASEVWMSVFFRS